MDTENENLSQSFHTSSTQRQNWSFNVFERMRMAAKSSPGKALPVKFPTPRAQTIVICPGFARGGEVQVSI